MPESINFFSRPLDLVFSARSHIALLRALRLSKEGMSGRAAAREAGINHQTCALAIKKLAHTGIIRRQGSGKTQLISLNFDHFLVKEILLPALKKERELAELIREEIVLRLGARFQCVVLFGSAARGEARQDSDVDLLLVAAPAEKEKALGLAEEFGIDFKKRFGSRLSPIVMTGSEVRARLKASDPLLGNILRDGVDLGRGKLSEILYDAKRKR